MITFTVTNKHRPKATIVMLVSLYGKQYKKSIGIGVPVKYWNDSKKRAQTTAENNEEVLVITSLTDEQSASDEDVNTANSTPQGTSRDAATKTKDESPDDSSDTSETTDSGSSE